MTADTRALVRCACECGCQTTLITRVMTAGMCTGCADRYGYHLRGAPLGACRPPDALLRLMRQTALHPPSPGLSS